MTDLKRSAFLSGEDYVQHKPADQIVNINQRRGIGNRTIIRPNFMSPEIKPRNVRFDIGQVSDQSGDVTLSEETLGKLFDVRIPDNTDVKWLAEKARLIALYRTSGMSDEEIERELEVNKPLAREQRTIHKKENITQSSLSVKNKLVELEQEIKEGRAESQQQQAQLLGQFALVLHDTNAINRLTQTQLQGLGTSLARLNIPKTPDQLGLPHIVDIDFYNQNAGMINLLLFSKVGTNPTPTHNYELIVKDYTGQKNGLPAISLVKMIRELNKQGSRRRYLNLLKGGIIGRDKMREKVRRRGGFNSPLVAISPNNR